MLTTTIVGPEHTDTIIIIETNIDDTDAERLGFLMEQLFDNGALDVTFTSIQMKKNRPAVKVTVLTSYEKMHSLTNVLFEGSGTLGVRIIPAQRIKCRREIKNINTPWGLVGIKISWWNEKIINIKPEYEDCVAISKKFSVPLNIVRQKVLEQYQQM